MSLGDEVHNSWFYKLSLGQINVISQIEKIYTSSDLHIYINMFVSFPTKEFVLTSKGDYEYQP